jgi:hypothetical protein
MHSLKQIDSSSAPTGKGSGGVSDGMRSKSSMGFHQNVVESIAEILIEVK